MILSEVAFTSPLFSDTSTYGKVVFPNNDNNSYGVAFKKGNEAKAKALSVALGEVFNSGTLKKNYIEHSKKFSSDDNFINNSWKLLEQSWLLK